MMPVTKRVSPVRSMWVSYSALYAIDSTAPNVRPLTAPR